MKILVISNLYPPHVLGGYEILCGQVCDNLSNRGHQVKVLTSNHGATHASEVEDGVTRTLELYLPFDQPAKMKRWRRMQTGRHNYRVTQNLIRTEKPDLVFIWSQLRLTLGSARAAEESGIPVVYTFNDEHIAGYAPRGFSWSPRQLPTYAADASIFRKNTLRALQLRHSTCISRVVRNRLLEQNVPIPRSEVIYQGIPLERFPMKDKPGQLGRPLRVLYVGQLHHYKGVHTLIKGAHQAARLLAEKNIEVHIVGSGDPTYCLELEALAAQGMAKVFFHGRIPHQDVPGVYRDHDILVFPSIWQEPFGLTHLEAMASGTPVISTVDGGHGEFLVEGNNALVFEKENDGMLAARILQLAEDHELSRSLALRARKLVEERFTLNRYMDDIEDLLCRVKAREGR